MSEEEDLPECFGSGPYMVDCCVCEWAAECHEAHDEAEAELQREVLDEEEGFYE